MLHPVSRIGFAFGNRRYDSAEATRQDMLDELKHLAPGFDAAGRSDEYLRARLDHVRENHPGTADAAMLASRQRAANAWRTDSKNRDDEPRRDEPQRADEPQRTDEPIDPDEMAMRARERNANAWKGKSGADLLETLRNRDGDESKVRPNPGARGPR